MIGWCCVFCRRLMMFLMVMVLLLIGFVCVCLR